jgi:hypothetical protein
MVSRIAIVTAWQRPRYASRASIGLKDSAAAPSHAATTYYLIVLAVPGYLMQWAPRPIGG